MTKTKNGGPAFPPNGGWQDNDPAGWGMSLRDWFAGQALPSILAAPVADEDGRTVLLYWGRETGLGWNHPQIPSRVASLAYAVADAMLAAREGQ